MENFEIILGKGNSLLSQIRTRGFKVPSKIQMKSIPRILEGKDVIAGASTGSGKTLAFAAGLISNVKKDYGIQGLVLTPTRELAEQITDELSYFSENKNLNVISVYGGVPINNQIRRLTNSEIVVGTPGRILDHINRNTIDLTRINTLVLDEADRMLDMGFREDVEKIIKKCPKKRQTLLFSATISKDVVHLAQKHMHDPIEISTEPHVDPGKLKQVYYDVEDNLKFSLLSYLLNNEHSRLVMIFCNTRKNVDFVAKNLQLMGIEAMPIHGGFSQDKRTRILKSFHSEKVYVLVATDVAARGLDIKGVTHIYNYDIPPTLDEYTHRIGRTARAGKEGKVINILTSRDYENFRNILKGDFKIIPEEKPFIKKERLRWIPERNRRYSGNQGSNRYSGNRRNTRERRDSGDKRNSRNQNQNRYPRNRGDSNRYSGDRRNTRERRDSGFHRNKRIMKKSWN